MEEVGIFYFVVFPIVAKIKAITSSLYLLSLQEKLSSRNEQYAYCLVVSFPEYRRFKIDKMESILWGLQNLWLILYGIRKIDS